MAKIIHFHFNLSRNKGDEANTNAVKSLLEKYIKIDTYTNRDIYFLTQAKYPKIIDNRIVKSLYVQTFIRLCKRYLPNSFFSKVKNWLLDNKKQSNQKLLELINEQDIMVIGGGGLFSAEVFPLQHEIINQIKIPIVLFGIGYNANLDTDPFSDEQIKSIVSLCQKTTLLGVRDAETTQFLSANGIKNIQEIGDPVIILDLHEIESSFIDRKKFVIGINIAYHYASLQDPVVSSRILNAYVQFLKKLQREREEGVQIIYLQHEVREIGIIKQLKKFFPEMIVCNQPAAQLRAIYEQLDFVLCMMLHSSIFAFSSLKPFVNIAYNYKNRYFMNLIGQQDNLIDMRNVTAENIYEMYLKVKDRDNFSQIIQIKYQLKSKTNEFCEQISDLLPKRELSNLKYLFICGSIAPTYCGIGKFTAKLVRMLQKVGVEVDYLTNTEQIQYNSADQSLSANIHHGNLLKFGLWSIFKTVNKIKPDIVSIQYQTFSSNILDVFFPLFIKIISPKTKVIITIHEFSVFNLKGKLRNAVAMFFADKVLFSDRLQLKTANSFSHYLLDYKLDTQFTGQTVQEHLPHFSFPDFDQDTLHIAYHGYIQPAKGLEYLLQALNRYDGKFHLHILGEFKTLLNYTNKTEIDTYQKTWHEYIQQNSNIHNHTTIHGDIEPGSKDFQDILSQCELIILPFTDYLTIRRSTFSNCLLNSNSILVSTYKEGFSEEYLSSIEPIEPDTDSILKYLKEYSKLSITQKQQISERQQQLKAYFLSPDREAEMLRQITLV